MGIAKDKETGLTEQEMRFAHNWLIWRNSTKAAISAGYSPKSAHVQGCRMLKKDKMNAYITKLREERNERLRVDSDDVLTELLDLLNTDQSEIFQPLRDANNEPKLDDEGNVIRSMDVMPISQWPSALRKHVLSYDVQEDEISGTKITKVKFPSKREVLKMIGDHTRVQAFVTKIEVKDTTEVSAKLTQARQRMAGNIEPSTN